MRAGMVNQYSASRPATLHSADALPTRSLSPTHRNDLSAAQPQPNDRGEINAFVPGLALRRAALKGATSSPSGDEIEINVETP